jgi:hypothetical protein
VEAAAMKKAALLLLAVVATATRAEEYHPLPRLPEGRLRQRAASSPDADETRPARPTPARGAEEGAAPGEVVHVISIPPRPGAPEQYVEDEGPLPDSAAPEDVALMGQEADPRLLDEPGEAEAPLPAPAEPPVTIAALDPDELEVFEETQRGEEKVQLLAGAPGEVIEVVRDAAGNLLAARTVEVEEAR